MKMYQFDKESIDPYFAELTPIELSEVVSYFHSSELTVPRIINEYGLPEISYSKFKKALPPILYPDNICPKCNKTSHILHLAVGKQTKPTCPICKSEMFGDASPYLSWLSNSLGIKFDNHKHLSCRSATTLTMTRKDFEQLDIECKVFIGCIINKAISEDFTTIEGVMLEKFKLVPNVCFLRDLMAKLGKEKFSPYAVKFKIHPEDSRKHFFPYAKLDLSTEEQLDLWKAIALQEVIEVFYGSLEEKGLISTQKEAVAPILKALLEDYSVGQIVNLIWQGVNWKYDEYLKGSRDKQHTANAIIYTCQNFANYKKTNSKLLACFQRPYKYPQSEISKYVYEHVLKIGEVGFNSLPSISNLAKTD